jgi:hypothetical protein
MHYLAIYNERRPNPARPILTIGPLSKEESDAARSILQLVFDRHGVSGVLLIKELDTSVAEGVKEAEERLKQLVKQQHNN